MKTNKPEAAHPVDTRAEFEAWITSPPYEKSVATYPDSSGWPGQYRAYDVQLAWEAYQAGRAESELLRKDAERYRWLCDGNGYFLEHEMLCGFENEKAEADTAIDAAMKGDKP